MKTFNIPYFESIKPLAMKRYALWLMRSPGYGMAIFKSMDDALKAHNDKVLSEIYGSFPAESEWFTKHLEKHPDALAVQTKLFDLKN